MEFLFIQLMQWGHDQGYEWFNLGMAPLSGIDSHRLGPVWNRVSSIVFHHGEKFYNFQGLRSYKSKFNPKWFPKYLASPGGLASARILANVSTLISGGFRRLLHR
jgi:phosphatidylglycerol lysyltransferase